jgi:GTP-binding protein EngB required for normal cell division
MSRGRGPAREQAASEQRARKQRARDLAPLDLPPVELPPVTPAPMTPAPMTPAPVNPAPANPAPGDLFPENPTRGEQARRDGVPREQAASEQWPVGQHAGGERTDAPAGDQQSGAGGQQPGGAQAAGDQVVSQQGADEATAGWLPGGTAGSLRDFRSSPFRVVSELSSRLSALARLVQIGAARSGPDGVSQDVLDDAGDLLARAGERLRLSSAHTVVALAGGTGSGKSSLFNRLAGADFSTVGVTRPVTRDVHACVWGVSGSGPLLEWLGVPRRYRYARASALDSGEQAMTGLVLLDLPDHDSVMAHATDQVDHLVELADLMIWVLDPQKYADAAVHRRFLVPLAGHSEVIAVVLNQSDVLSPVQIEDCVQDLRRLLDAEELHDVQILLTSAATGAGVDTLRELLVETVSARQAATVRISADVDGLVARLAPYGGEDPMTTAPGGLGAESGINPADGGAVAGNVHNAAGTVRDNAVRDNTVRDNTMQDNTVPDNAPASGQPVTDSRSAVSILAASPRKLAAAFARAAGVAAIGDALQSARELRAVDYVGWPVSWIVERLVRRDPVRKIRLGKLWAELRGVTAGPSGAQQAEIDNALTQLADEVSPGLPKPWSNTVRAAIRSRADDIPAALGERIGAALPAEDTIAGWWRAIGVWQGFLLGCVIVGLAWIAAILAFGVFHTGSNVPRLFSDVSLLPLIGILIVAMLVLGWLTATACVNAVRTAAIRENEQVARDMQDRMAGVAQELVVAPAQQELFELDRFRAELRAASGQAS